MKRILLVDDEKQILRALSRVFLEAPYEIYTASSGKEALAILAETRIDMIISDMRMPYMNGYQLLNQVKVRHPEMIRVILSGYSEENTILEALNKNVAKNFIFKPWDNEQLLLIIAKTFKSYDSFQSKNIAKFINNLETIPVLEGNHKRLIKALEENQNIRKIVCEITKDQAITTKVLRIAQSSYYQENHMTKPLKVEDAIESIGMKNLAQLVGKTSVVKCNYCQEDESKFIEKIWQHSRISSKLISLFYKEFLQKPTPSLAFVAGLLHNLGILLMFEKYKKEYLSFVSKYVKGEQTIEQQEISLFGISHAELGGCLLEWWDFPRGVVEAATYHHKPTDQLIVNKELVYIIHIVNYYTFQLLKLDNYATLEADVFSKLCVSQNEWERELTKIEQEGWYSCE